MSRFNLETILSNDFAGTHQNSIDLPITDTGGNAVTIRIIDFRNEEDGAEFLGAYIPRTAQTLSIVTQVLVDHQSLLKKLGHGGVALRAYGQEGEQSADWATFTKLVFIYYEGELTLQQRASIEALANSLGIRVILRGFEYLSTRPKEIIIPK